MPSKGCGRAWEAQAPNPTAKGAVTVRDSRDKQSTALPAVLLLWGSHLAAQIHFGNASSTSPAQGVLQPLALHGVCPPTAALQNCSLTEPPFPRKQPVEGILQHPPSDPPKTPPISILTFPWPELMEQEPSTCSADLKTPNKGRGKTRVGH